MGAPVVVVVVVVGEEMYRAVLVGGGIGWQALSVFVNDPQVHNKKRLEVQL